MEKNVKVALNAVMESPLRNVTVFSVVGNVRKSIQTRATSWKELVEELNMPVLNQSDVKITEGKSGFEFTENTLQLPNNIRTDAGYTNDLTIFVTPKAKIKSGADTRSEVFARVKLMMNKRPESVKEFNMGKNYTNKPTAELLRILNKYSANKASKEETVAHVNGKIENAKVGDILISPESLKIIQEGLEYIQLGIKKLEISGIASLTVKADSSTLSVADLQKWAKKFM